MKKYSIKEYVDNLKQNGLLARKSKLFDSENVVVENLSYNSNNIKDNTLFICKGASFKEQYLDMAIEKGAIAYVSTVDYEKSIPCLQVNNIQKALSLVSNIYFNYPWKELNLIGITGTKGKTTTSYYVKYIFDEYLSSIEAKPTGILSSINTYDGVEEKEANLTTPESLELQMHFRNAANNTLKYMVIEASSQALKYGRLYGVNFDVGVFLNISEDHISPIEHENLEDYFSSKLTLFNHCNTACININTDHAARVLDAARNCRKVITFGINNVADICGYNIHQEGTDTVFNVRTELFDREFRITMPGSFNVENALAAIAVAHSFDIPVEFIYSGLLKAKSSGRMELYTTKNSDKMVIVDYAHNKLSFTKLYEWAKTEYPDRKIITVFGCPGGKAFGRRIDLGLLSGLHSDKVYLTAEDPGMESVKDICLDIAQHVKVHNNNYEIIEDREEAIKASIETADTNSIILITGKGHETTQKIGKEYVLYPTDVECVKKYLK